MHIYLHVFNDYRVLRENPRVHCITVDSLSTSGMLCFNLSRDFLAKMKTAPVRQMAETRPRTTMDATLEPTERK